LLASRDYLRVGWRADDIAVENQIVGSSKVVFIEHLSIVTHADISSSSSRCGLHVRVNVSLSALVMTVGANTWDMMSSRHALLGYLCV